MVSFVLCRVSRRIVRQFRGLRCSIRRGRFAAYNPTLTIDFNIDSMRIARSLF
ncbi:hypothetical protein [Azospirillum doebereinerae]